jgi:hypothetical protein
VPVSEGVDVEGAAGDDAAVDVAGVVVDAGSAHPPASRNSAHSAAATALIAVPSVGCHPL